MKVWKCLTSFHKALFSALLFCKYCTSHVKSLPPANFCAVLREQQQQKDSLRVCAYVGGVVAAQEVFFIIIPLRHWQLYAEAAAWTFGRHLLEHSSSIIQMQCMHEWSYIVPAEFNKIVPAHSLTEAAFSYIFPLQGILQQQTQKLTAASSIVSSCKDT